MPTPATIRDELASVPELASLNLDRAALRIAERKPLIEPIADTGRYQISVDLCFESRVVSESTRCDDIEVARATLAVFKREHAADSNALGGIYDSKTFSYVETWRGGEAFGPRDTRHPLERIFGRLIAKGDPVTIIDPRGIRTFNDADNRRGGE